MHMLRKAAVVAAMVGGVGVFGAGVATAQEIPAVGCEQSASGTSENCGFGNDGSVNTGGTALGGSGTGAGIVDGAA